MAAATTTATTTAYTVNPKIKEPNWFSLTIDNAYNERLDFIDRSEMWQQIWVLLDKEDPRSKEELRSALCDSVKLCNETEGWEDTAILHQMMYDELDALLEEMLSRKWLIASEIIAPAADETVDANTPANPDVKASMRAALEQHSSINTFKWAFETGFSAEDAKTAAFELLQEGYATSVRSDHVQYTVTAKGDECAKKGSPEARLWGLLADGPKDIFDIKDAFGDKELTKTALSRAIQNKWIRKTAQMELERAVETVDDVACTKLTAFKQGVLLADADYIMLEKLALITKVLHPAWNVSKV